MALLRNISIFAEVMTILCLRCMMCSNGGVDGSWCRLNVVDVTVEYGDNVVHFLGYTVVTAEL